MKFRAVLILTCLAAQLLTISCKKEISKPVDPELSQKESLLRKHGFTKVSNNEHLNLAATKKSPTLKELTEYLERSTRISSSDIHAKLEGSPGEEEVADYVWQGQYETSWGGDATYTYYLPELESRSYPCLFIVNVNSGGITSTNFLANGISFGTWSYFQNWAYNRPGPNAGPWEVRGQVTEVLTLAEFTWTRHWKVQAEGTNVALHMTLTRIY